MHQKQPPAKIAVFVAGVEEFCATTCATGTAASAGPASATKKVRFILSSLDTVLPPALLITEVVFCLPLTRATVITGGAQVTSQTKVSPDRKSTRLNSSHIPLSRMPSS